MARHVQRRHPERIGLHLERALAAEERFAGERIDLGNLLVRHGIAAARRTIAVDHQKGAGAPVRLIEIVGETDVDGEIVRRVGIHLPGRDGVETFRRLAVAFLDLGAKLAGPATDRIGLEQRKPPFVILLPDFELRLLLEQPHQDRRFLRHVPAFELAQHLLRQWLERANGRRDAVGLTSRERYRSGNSRRRHQRIASCDGTSRNRLLWCTFKGTPSR